MCGMGLVCTTGPTDHDTRANGIRGEEQARARSTRPMSSQSSKSGLMILTLLTPRLYHGNPQLDITTLAAIVASMYCVQYFHPPQWNYVLSAFLSFTVWLLFKSFSTWKYALI